MWLATSQLLTGTYYIMDGEGLAGAARDRVTGRAEAFVGRRARSEPREPVALTGGPLDGLSLPASL